MSETRTMSGAAPTLGSPGFRPSPEFITRQRRLEDAKNLRKPDRVPVVPLVLYYPNISRGVPNRDMHYDRVLRARILRDAIVEHDWDAAVPLGHLPEARPLELLGATQFKWPGGGLADHLPFQFIEGEYMLQDEYDEMLADPTGFAVRKLWPRVATTLAPASALAQEPLPPVLYFSDSRGLPGLIGGMLSDPELMAMLGNIQALGKEMAAGQEAMAGYAAEMMRLGYPLFFDATTTTAFDCISDFLRGLRGSLMDMYQVPDKLLAAIDLYIPWTIEQSVAWARRVGNEGVFIPLHRGAAGFMSNEQFAKFYWPSLKALLLGLVEAGLTPVPFFEGDYTPRLEFLQELPPGKIIGHFDRIDRKKAKALIGDTLCFWGNVPCSLLCSGTVQEVKDDVKRLIDIFADNGGLIIDGSVGIPDEARRENVLALTQAARGYGSEGAV